MSTLMMCPLCRREVDGFVKDHESVLRLGYHDNSQGVQCEMSGMTLARNKCICRTCKKQYNPARARGELNGFCSAKCQHEMANRHGYRRNGSRSEYQVLNSANEIGSVLVGSNPKLRRKKHEEQHQEGRQEDRQVLPPQDSQGGEGHGVGSRSSASAELSRGSGDRHGERDCSQPDQQAPRCVREAKVKFAGGKQGDGWYVVRPAYLYKDGTWHSKCQETDRDDGYYNSEPEAREVLEAPFVMTGEGMGI